MDKQKQQTVAGKWTAAPEAGDVAQPVDPMIGFRWLDYSVEKKLGEGGMGCVYRLKHTKWTNRYFAMKVLNADSPQHIVERFQQEADVAAAIENHRVVKPIHHAQLADGRWYIVMEYVDGQSLESLIAAGPLTVKDALQIGVRIAETMTEMHRAQFIHRDLKPANIMLTSEGRRERLVKLLDFGVVKAAGEKRVVATQAAINVGTPGYWSPEAAMAQDQDGRTDVFSLGVILFEMLTGRLPFPFDANDGPAAVAAATSLLMNEAPTVTSARPSHLDPVPKDLASTIARALEKKPDARLAMSELFAELKAIYDRLSHEAGIVRAPMPTQLSAEAPELETLHKKPTLAKPRPNLDRLLEKYSSGPTPIAAPPPSASATPKRPTAKSRTPTATPTMPSAAAPKRSRAVWWLASGFIVAVGIVGSVWKLRTRPPATAPIEPAALPRASESPSTAPLSPPRPLAAPTDEAMRAPHAPPAVKASVPRTKKSPPTTKAAPPRPAPLPQAKPMKDRVIDPFGAN